MKLIKFGTQGSEKPGVLLSNGTSIDVSACTPDFNEAFFESDGLHRLSSWIENHAATGTSANSRRRSPSTPSPSTTRSSDSASQISSTESAPPTKAPYPVTTTLRTGSCIRKKSRPA